MTVSVLVRLPLARLRLYLSGMTGTLDDFKAVANFDGDGWGLYGATRGTDYDIEPWQWLAEAAPFANTPDEQRRVQWGRSWVAYNAWASALGKPAATMSDLQRAGMGADLLPSAQAVLTWPAWNDPGADFTAWSESDLIHHLATIRARQEAMDILARSDGLSHVGEVEHAQPVEALIGRELERRGLRS